MAIGASQVTKSPRPPKWEKCMQEGYSMLLGSTFFGTVSSLMTRSYGPLLLMGSVGLFVAVEHCDQIFKKKD